MSGEPPRKPRGQPWKVSVVILLVCGALLAAAIARDSVLLGVMAVGVMVMILAMVWTAANTVTEVRRASLAQEQEHDNPDHDQDERRQRR